MSVAVGPSGRNDVYLLHLHEFLSNTAGHSSAVAEMLKDHAHDDRTGELAGTVKQLQSDYRPYFLFGAGSNEHNQLLLNNVGDVENVDEVNELTEMLLVVPRQKQSEERSHGHEPKSLYSGGGHSAFLTRGGDMYLWGWNEAGQLGRKESSASSTSLLDPIRSLGINVETADLGHTHTLVIEKDTKRLFAFGENGRGQVTGSAASNIPPYEPRTPFGLEDETFVDVAAGLFHSAAITELGELITWGCTRFGQCVPSHNTASSIGRWSPSDGSKLKQVVCGRRHTIMLDEHQRVWSMGDNKYGQLGRLPGEKNSEPQLVDGILGEMNSKCVAIYCGWSHVLALTGDKGKREVALLGWGRNDKCQLGLVPSTSNQNVPAPQVIPVGNADTIESACCGAESSHVLDSSQRIYSTGWNEHGNLGVGLNNGKNDTLQWKRVSGASIVAPPAEKNDKTKLLASGGAHLIVMMA